MKKKAIQAQVQPVVRRHINIIKKYFSDRSDAPEKGCICDECKVVRSINYLKSLFSV
jgi:hypothetical protein